MQSRGCVREPFGFARFFPASWVRASVILLAAGGATLLFTGCGPTRVRVDFTRYENSYAVTSNHEVLLNLARLRQHDPTYFFKLGQISSTYQMQAGLSGTGNLATVSSPPATTVPIGGGTPTAAYQNYSAFSFIPVTDEANATLLLQPISEDVFYSLYQQGWRVDQLFRLMVDRIEVTLPIDSSDPGKGCRVEIIRNVPPPPYENMHSAGAERDLSRYVTFLRVSAMVYELQKHGLLQLGGQTVFQPLDRKSALEADKDFPQAKDVVDAAAKNQVWESQKGADDKQQWLLGAMAPRPAFQLSTIRLDNISTGTGKKAGAAENTYGDNVQREEAFLTKLFSDDPGLSAFVTNLPASPGALELTDILEILYNGFAIGGSPTQADTGQDTEIGPCATESSTNPTSQTASKAAPASVAGSPAASASPAALAAAASGPPAPGTSSPASTAAGNPSAPRQEGRVACRLVMRSLIGLMAASAQEEEAFDTLTQNNPLVHVELRAPSKNGQPPADELMCTIHKVLKGGAPGERPIDDACKTDSTPQFNFNQLVPTIERLPVLRLTWQKPNPAYVANPQDISPPAKETAEQLKQFGLSVNYKKQDYWISDFDLSRAGPTSDAGANADSRDWAAENQYWNRDMFRLINHLTAQVTVDISKFPLPAILQLPIQ